MGKSYIAAPLPRVRLDFIIIIWDLLIPFRIFEFSNFWIFRFSSGLVPLYPPVTPGVSPWVGW